MRKPFMYYRPPLNWRDWRFGFVVRSYPHRQVDIALGPLAFECWPRRRR